MCPLPRGRIVVVVLALATWALLFGLPSVGAQDPAWEAKELSRHPMPRGVQPADLIVSPGGTHLAYVEGGSEGQRLVINGKPGPKFKVIEGPRFAAGGGYTYFGAGAAGVEVVTQAARFGPYLVIDLPSLQLSADGEHVAYVAEAPPQADAAPGSGQAVYRDGVAGPAEPKITSLVISPTGAGVAYLVSEPSAQRVVLLGKRRGEPFDEIDPASLRISADGTTPAYTARKGKTWHVVFGDVVGPGVARIGGRLLALSPDGRRWACWAGVGPKPRYLVDGKEHAAFQQVGDHPPLFSADSKHVIYTAQDEKGWHMLVDGQIVQSWSAIAGLGTLASADGSQLLYAAQRDGKWWMQAGAQTLGPYDAIGDDMQDISKDGKHSVFAARRGSNWYIVHDGVESAPINAVVAVALSPDGTQRAYGAIVSGQPNLVVGDLVLEGRFVLPKGLAFDAQNALHALVAQNPQAPQLVTLAVQRKPE